MSVHDFTGIAKWAKVKTPEEFRGTSKYSIDLYLDKDELSRFRGLDLAVKIRKDDSGTFVKLSRYTEKEFKGERVTFEAPKLWYNGEAFDGLIGNGSKVTCRVTVYGDKVKAHRLEAVRIDELVEYNPDGSSVDLPF
jgi:hypothetical protein